MRPPKTPLPLLPRLAIAGTCSFVREGIPSLLAAAVEQACMNGACRTAITFEQHTLLYFRSPEAQNPWLARVIRAPEGGGAGEPSSKFVGQILSADRRREAQPYPPCVCCTHSHASHQERSFIKIRPPCFAKIKLREVASNGDGGWRKRRWPAYPGRKLVIKSFSPFYMQKFSIKECAPARLRAIINKSETHCTSTLGRCVL